MKSFVRKHLCVPGLLSRVRSQYEKVTDKFKRGSGLSLTDCLMSGLALFGLKYPSLLKFDADARTNERVQHNLKSLYQIERVPSDTYLRERLDPIAPYELQRGIDRIIAQLQRGKVLECYRYIDDSLLVAIDGTGCFSSHKIHCENCCVKHHRDGSQTYYHQMLAAVVVHPEHKTVFPLMLEPIHKQDGAKKNDCEHTALKRLLENLRRAHPHLKLVVTLDGLYADGVILNLLKELDIRFIITAHEKDLKYLYEFYNATQKNTQTITQSHRTISLSFANGLPLNDTHHQRQVNLLCAEETIVQKRKTKQQKFAWITDMLLSPSNVQTIMKGGRSRWRIENETFNTLKNQGYQFEHNFGHGYENLNVVMAYLMFTAFLIDQVQEFSCKHFKAALKKAKRLKYLWERIKNYFLICTIDSWEQLYTAIQNDVGIPLATLLAPNTS